MQEFPLTARGRVASPTDCARCLRTLDCWPLTPAARTRVAATREPQRAAGQALWRQGERLRGLFVITRGSVKLVEQSADGTESIAGFRFAGDLVGLDALADGYHTDEAVALEEVAACRLHWDRNAESDAFSALDRELLSRQALEARRLRAQRRLARRSAVAAVADCLAQLSRSLVPDSCGGVRLPMSGAELANYLGLADATLSRALAALERDGRIERDGRRLRWRQEPRGRRAPRTGSASSGFSGQ